MVSPPSTPPHPSTPPNKLRKNSAFPHLSSTDTPTLADVAKLLRDGTAKNVIVMAGAGISTGAGIPDFRSPGTGLYDNLAKYDLPYPEAIFDIEYLEERPEAFYTLAKELYPGNFNPTTTHYFFKLLQDKRILKGVWTQNIDTLERIAGIEDDYIVEAHGSFASAACLRCKKRYTKEEIKPMIMRGEVVRCQERRCKGKQNALIKPEIVFFGEGLPDVFFERLPDFNSCDLLLVLGTSLSVGPFNSLLHRVPASCPRVLINLELVGEAKHPWEEGFRFNESEAQERRDLFWKGESDAAVGELCRLVGEEWETELRELKRRGWEELDKTNTAMEKETEEKREEVVKEVGEAVDTAEEKKGDEVEELTKGVAGVELESKKEDLTASSDPKPSL
ncbi:SIR2 family NAD-dependent protein deacylase [Sporobolomyces salmoneus]|uniref:SIR2 family NAD-dependent protein deacylase n=1 Tax=Sporobolomyces salmoneus TaxID=183962 RepID=UPI00316F9650